VVLYLLKLLTGQKKVAVLSRGYKRATKGYLAVDINKASGERLYGDEPFLIANEFPNSLVVVCEDRVEGVRQILGNHPEIEVIIMDDGFQHRRIKAGFNILLSDFAKPFYKDFILPTGNLRESRKSANRANLMLITKCKQELNSVEKLAISEKIRSYYTKELVFSKSIYGKLKAVSPIQDNTNPIKNLRRVLAVAGIGKPEYFINYINQHFNHVESILFKDHKEYNTQAIALILKEFNLKQCEAIVTTSKDWIKLMQYKDSLLKDINIFILPIEIGFELDEKTKFDNIITAYVRKNN
jgi:tetraacyldisaccharide 4'-kinase